MQLDRAVLSDPDRTDPLVSAIIPNYNYARYIGEAVESVLAQTYSPIEIIVVDDGSTDTSIGILAKYADRITVLSQSNSGVSIARNAGVKASSGEYVAFLDADDVWEPEKIERQVAAFNDAGVGIVHVGVTDINEKGELLERHLDGLEGEVADEFLKWERPVILGGGSGAMVSRTVFEDAGEFDPDLMTSADWDFHYRVCRNTRAAFVAEPLLRYRIHGNNMHSNVQRMEREMTLFYKKAFADPDQRIQKLRRRAMGNFYRILAGSYFQSGQYADFARNSFKSLWNRPSQLGYFMKFPLRRLK